MKSFLIKLFSRKYTFLYFSFVAILISNLMPFGTANLHVKVIFMSTFAPILGTIYILYFISKFLDKDNLKIGTTIWQIVIALLNLCLISFSVLIAEWFLNYVAIVLIMTGIYFLICLFSLITCRYKENDSTGSHAKLSLLNVIFIHSLTISFCSLFNPFLFSGSTFVIILIVYLDELFKKENKILKNHKISSIIFWVIDALLMVSYVVNFVVLLTTVINGEESQILIFYLIILITSFIHVIYTLIKYIIFGIKKEYKFDRKYISNIIIFLSYLIFFVFFFTCIFGSTMDEYQSIEQVLIHLKDTLRILIYIGLGVIFALVVYSLIAFSSYKIQNLEGNGVHLLIQNKNKIKRVDVLYILGGIVSIILLVPFIIFTSILELNSFISPIILFLSYFYIFPTILIQNILYLIKK